MKVILTDTFKKQLKKLDAAISKRETAVAFKRLGIDIAKIAEGTGLSVEEIEKL